MFLIVAGSMQFPEIVSLHDCLWWLCTQPCCLSSICAGRRESVLHAFRDTALPTAPHTANWSESLPKPVMQKAYSTFLILRLLLLRLLLAFIYTVRSLRSRGFLASTSFSLSGPQWSCTRRLSSLLPSFNTMHLDCASSSYSSAGYLTGMLCSSHSYCACTSISMHLCQWVSWIGSIRTCSHHTAQQLTFISQKLYPAWKCPPSQMQSSDSVFIRSAAKRSREWHAGPDDGDRSRTRLSFFKWFNRNVYWLTEISVRALWQRHVASLLVRDLSHQSDLPNLSIIFFFFLGTLFSIVHH